MKILLLGKSGLLGRALFHSLQKEHTCITPPHELCDVTDEAQLRHAIDENKPDLVINATGYTAVDAAEDDDKKAFLLNARAVEHLTRALHLRSIPLVHFSTDYVFDGTKKEGYREDDLPHPLSAYGHSKAEGEKILIASGIPYFCIRTSWLFGEGGTDFIDKILAHARQGAPLNVVNDQTGSPTYAADLAKALLPVLQSKSYGMYHIRNSGSCTWFEYAEEIFRQLGWPQKIIPVASSNFPSAAKRPENSILLNTKLPPLRHWKEALEEYLSKKVLTLTP